MELLKLSTFLFNTFNIILHIYIFFAFSFVARQGVSSRTRSRSNPTVTLLDHHYSPSYTDRGTMISCVMLLQLWGGGDNANMQNKIDTVDTEIISIHV